MSFSQRSAGVLTVLCCIAYAAVRLWRLTASCLWFDEIFSVDAAKHGWNSILNFVALDLIHPPFFYLLLKLWVVLGGEGLLWLRLFPIIFACLAVLPFLMICREMKLSAWTRNTALFLFAVNGSLIKYAQEVRMYSLLMFLSLASIWLFTRYFIKGKSFVPLLIVNLLLVYTHYFGWFVVFTEVIAIGWFQRVKLRRMLLQFGILLAAFLPWVIAVVSAARSGSEVGQNIGWMQRPGLSEIGTLIVNLIEPFYSQMSSAETVTRYLVSLPLLLLVIALAILSVIVRRKRSDEDGNQRSAMLALFVAVPIVAAFTASWLLPYSVWGTRHLIVVFVPLTLLIGIAVDKLSLNWLKVSLAGVIVVLSAIAFIAVLLRPEPNNIWCAWGPLADKAADLGAAKIYVFEDIVAYHAWFDLRGREIPQASKVTNIEGIIEDKAYFIPRGRDDLKQTDIVAIDGSPIWIMYRGPRIDAAMSPLNTFIAKGYKIVERDMYAARTDNAILLKLEK